MTGVQTCALPILIHALGVLEQATGPWQSPVVEVAELWVNFMNGVAVEPTL